MEDKELEKFLEVMLLKFNLKTVAVNLGFINNNGTLFVMSDVYETYLKFDDDHLAVWNSGNSNRKILKKYDEIYEGINNGLYDKKGFLKNLLDLLSV